MRIALQIATRQRDILGCAGGAAPGCCCRDFASLPSLVRFPGLSSDPFNEMQMAAPAVARDSASGTNEASNKPPLYVTGSVEAVPEDARYHLGEKANADTLA